MTEKRGNEALIERRKELADALCGMVLQYSTKSIKDERWILLPPENDTMRRAYEMLGCAEGDDFYAVEADNGTAWKWDGEREVDCSSERWKEKERALSFKDPEEFAAENREYEQIAFSLMVIYCNRDGLVDHLCMSAGETVCEVLGLKEYGSFSEEAVRLGFNYDSSRDKSLPRVDSKG